jgi:hypothetical protein
MLRFILTPAAGICEGSGAFATLRTIYSNLRGTLPVLFLDVPGHPVEFALRWEAGRGIIPVVWYVARTPDRTVPRSGMYPVVPSTGKEPVYGKPRMRRKE